MSMTYYTYEPVLEQSGYILKTLYRQQNGLYVSHFVICPKRLQQIQDEEYKQNFDRLVRDVISYHNCLNYEREMKRTRDRLRRETDIRRHIKKVTRKERYKIKYLSKNI